jgi:hypothetical protein
MKHENNFLLYSLGSAFLLVAGAMLLSIPPDSPKLVAQVSVASTVNETSFVVPTASLSGKVYLDTNNDYILGEEDKGVSNIEIGLIKEGDDIFDITQITSTLTDESGFYSFEEIPLGGYYLSVLSDGGFVVTAPEPRVQGFSDPVSSAFISLSGSGQYYGGMDFVLRESRESDVR